MNEQLALWPEQTPVIPEVVIDPMSYDFCLVMFSGGKDSLACFLHLLEIGVPKDRIELWHHCVDGREGSTLMDWPVTESYCRRIAEAFNVPIFFSWKQMGFEGELLRENALTAPTSFETPEGVQTSGGIQGTFSTRRKFPQVAASLTTRWCSGYLKCDVGSKAVSGQRRFDGKRVLLVTGERAEESSNRACYKQVESHKTSTSKRTVDQWRAVHQWSEQKVWDVIQKYGVAAHPCYEIGMSRCSCACCIFSSPHQWATMAEINPAQVDRIAAYEEEFGVTINRKRTVREMIAAGKPYTGMDPEQIRLALSSEYDAPIMVGDKWRLPNGAFGEGGGPT